ncbi:THAP domain-containing 11, partial [Paramuricea clavata]
SNTKRNPELSYYQIPTDKKLRKMWLHWIGRANFTPNNHHRVCSKHFVGGKKTCLHNVPTIVQKLLLPTKPKPRTTSKCRNRDITIEESPEIEDEPTSEDRILELEELVENLQQKDQEQQEKISDLKGKVEHTFKAFYDYLCPACERLQYIGSWNTTKPTENREKCGPRRTLSPEEELFLCLVRFRLGLLERDLANRFNISESHVSRIWVTWLDFLYRRLRSIPIWPSQSYVRETSPPSFKESYPNTRVIIDCTELFIETPSQPRSQSATFSTYKNHNTGKGLIGIAPRGYLTFVSELYAGNTSDKQLTNDCGILKLLEPGDEVMADRGFEIENDLPPGVSLNIPPFLGEQAQFSKEDEIKTRRIAKHRIHVERAIQRIKSFQLPRACFWMDTNQMTRTCHFFLLQYLKFYAPLS